MSLIEQAIQAEQELRENQEQLKQELEAVNQQQEQYWRSFVGR